VGDEMTSQLQLKNLNIPINGSDVFHFDIGCRNFDAMAVGGKGDKWSSRELSQALGYVNYESFKNSINKAIHACVALGIDIAENFEQITSEDGCKYYQLTRFACYLVAMNADPKKVEVARAQVYFAAVAESFKRYVEQADDVERLLIREDITDHEKALNAAAKNAGVGGGSGFAFFQNAGYRGMYNMNLAQLKALKNVPANRSPLDFMGKTELAANLFRITQTEEKLKNDNVSSQRMAEQTAEVVGKKVRQTMRELSGVLPEHLPAAEDIKQVKGALKHSAKEFAKIDSKKKPQDP
jgi:DNA-damage-inducible protein D